MMKKNLSKLHVLVLLIGFLAASCSKNKDIPQPVPGVSVSGKAEKGPFSQGAEVTVTELDKALQPTGRSFKTKILDDRGSFELLNIPLENDVVQLTVKDGYYFNELTGQQSKSPLTLSTLANIRTQEQLNINVLGQLEEKRVRYLVTNKNLDFAAAKKQAITELYKALFVKTEAKLNSERIGLTDENEHAAVLLGLSATLLKASDADQTTLNTLMVNIGRDLETDGTLSQELSNSIKNNLTRLNTDIIAFHMRENYKKYSLDLKDFNIQQQFSVDIVGENGGTNFLQSLQDFEAFHQSILLDMVRLSEQYFILEGLYAQTVTQEVANDYLAFRNHQISASNTLNRDLYAKHYALVNKVNLLITQARQTKLVEAQHYQYRAYPYLALLYDQLINLWGDPVFIHPDNYDATRTNLSIARSNTATVRTALIRALQDVIPQLADADEAFARTILARQLRDQGLYTEAAEQLDRVIQSGKYSLAALSETHLKKSPEGILSWDFGATSSIARSPNAKWYEKGNYQHIIRYSEIVLMRSEIYYNLGNVGKSLDQLNMIRKKNGGSVLLTDGQSLLLAIIDAYALEMKNEGQYFSALKRAGQAALKLSVDKYKLVLPIPQIELQANFNLTQNPEY